MRILSLTQPWATLVAIGAKRIETRSWRTPYRGPVAIHAAKGFAPEARDLCFKEPFCSTLLSELRENEAGQFYAADVFKKLPFGCIVAVCDLTEIHDTDDILFALPPEPERSFGDYSPDRYAWQLENIRRLATPLECKGAQGLRELPPQTVAKIMLQLSGGV